ncbi:family 43 glycosylhydrolase [Streptomyces canus]|uniref:family 43 glycosylhydrolase n=1 Tax=Streptomyces canus TaxID=58343 RepID=UPI00277DAE20|nr:family 43 glycosylhydrolase [Streptomyces canus]MDQ1066804.1 beta-xylosidase [Streptomyces canus]
MTLLHNPVIRGFAPDPSMVRVGDWYYVATSSFEWFPTIPLHRSRDLAHWEYAGHVEGAVPGNSLAGVPDSGGIWAPSLSWDGERFWVVYSIVRSVGTPYFDTDTYVCTATEAVGEWTAPRRIASHGFDPALFHDEGRLWLLNLQNDHRPGGRRFAGIVLTELDRETLTPVGDTHLLLQHERLVEGPKLVRKDGWYHLVLAEGGTGFEHGVLVARSREITGPYELDERPLLTSRDDPSLPLQKAGHGELVQLPDGSWVLSHLTARPLNTPDGPRCPLGRETAIQAVTWDADGWPRLRHGGPHPSTEVDVSTHPRLEGGAAAPAHPGPEAQPGTPTHPGPQAQLGAPAPAQRHPAVQPAAPTHPRPQAQPGTQNHPRPEDKTPAPAQPHPAIDTTAPLHPRPQPQTVTPAHPGPQARPGSQTHPGPQTQPGVPAHPGSQAHPDTPAQPHPAAPTAVPTHPRSSKQLALSGDPLGWPWSTLRAAPDPSWVDAGARPGWIRLRGRHGPESWWAHSLLAQRITEHRAEAEVTVAARPTTFTQAAGLVLWYNTESYLALDLTWAEPEGEEQRGQQWRGGGRTVLSLVERDEGSTRQVAVVDVQTESAFTLGVTVEDGVARFWRVDGDGARIPVGPELDFTRLSDDHGSKLRFTGAMAGIHAVDLVGAVFTADFTGFRLSCG